jgi:Tfp pilus assembly protein PilO
LNITPENQKMLSTGALVLAVLTLIAALGLALWPIPNTTAQIKTLDNKAFTAELQGKKAMASSEAQHQAALKQSWSGTGNEIGPTAYSNINAIANGLNVKIVNFREQRTTDAGDVTQMPFVVNAQGRYEDVVAFVHKIETTPSKLAVELFQLGATDESTDQVTATIGLEAYILNDDTAPEPTNPGSKPKTGAKPVENASPQTSRPSLVIKQKEVIDGKKK